MPEIQRRKFLGTAGLALAAVGSRPALGHNAPSGKIKIGQIGVGHAHATKLSVYRASDAYEVVGIVEPDAELRARATEHAAFRDVPWMTQEQLLNVPDLQVVLVETRVSDLLDVAENCIQAGKHIHLDKPAGESLPQFKRILNRASSQQLMVQMGYMYRYNPAVVLLHQFLKRGWLGDVFEVHAVMSKVVNPASRQALAAYEGGIMFELGCHLLDLVVGILGAPNHVAPFAQHASSRDDQLVDNMLTVLTYPRAIASVKSSAQEVEGFARRHLVVCGSEGTFHIQPLDNPSARIALARRTDKYQAGIQEVTFPKYTRYVDDAADMAAVLRGERDPRFSYEHDLAVQTTLLRSSSLLKDDERGVM